MTTPTRRMIVSGLALSATTFFVNAPHAAALLQPPAKAGEVADRRCLDLFIAMVNDPSEANVRAFETTCGSKERAKKATIEERIVRAGKLRDEFGTLTVKECHIASDGAVTAQVQAGKGQMISVEFERSTTEPGRINGILISSGPGAGPSQPITSEQRASVIEETLRKLEEGYVYPEVAKAMATSVRGKAKAGEYDSLSDERALARRLTDDLREVSRDKHLGVVINPAASGHAAEGMPGIDEMRKENYAFRKVEVLPGNVGYLKFDLFVDTEEAKAVATAAMGFLANCDSIIFDLRDNGGGSPEMIQYITSYLFEEPAHLNDMVDRNGKVVEEYWTLKDIPGTRLAKDIPVFVLTSSRTFSGAEEFSYNLKSLKRGTIVGQTTGGGAHPVRGERLTGDRFVVRVPFMRAQNPITRTNWEGTGVAPDVECAAGEALDRALELARKSGKP